MQRNCRRSTSGSCDTPDLSDPQAPARNLRQPNQDPALQSESGQPSGSSQPSGSGSKRKNDDRPPAERAPSDLNRPNAQRTSSDPTKSPTEPSYSNDDSKWNPKGLPTYDTKGGLQLQPGGGARAEHGSPGADTDYSYHRGEFAVPPGTNPEDGKKMLSQQSGHLTQAYGAKDSNLKKGEMPGDLTGQYTPNPKGPNGEDCGGVFCMHTSEVKKTPASAHQDADPSKPVSALDAQKNDAATSTGAHGEIGTTANAKKINGIPDMQGGQPAKLPEGSWHGSVNLPNAAGEKQGGYNPAQVVPQKSCTGSENCDGMMHAAGSTDVFPDAHTNTIPQNRESQQNNQWTPGSLHPWAQGTGGGGLNWDGVAHQKRALYAAASAALRRRTILKRTVDDFSRQQQKLVRRAPTWDTPAAGVLTARQLGLAMGMPSYGAMAAA